MAKYQLTRPVWVGAERLPKGAVLEFKGKPTGVYVGRCEPVGKAQADAPDAGAELAIVKMALADAEADLAKAKGAAALSDAELVTVKAALADAEAKAAPPPPPKK